MSRKASPILDYRASPVTKTSSDAGLLFVCGTVAGLFGTAILGGMVEALRETWPSFGMVLIAVPVGLVAFAFLTLSATAFRGMRTQVPP